MTLDEFYKNIGGDLNEVLDRVPSEGIILSVLSKFKDDKSKEQLDEAIKAKNPVDAFRAVHTLKGVTLSLGLTSLAEPAKTLTEDLRPGSFGEGWEANYEKLCLEYKRLVSLIDELNK